MDEKKERKTETLLASDQLVHLYQRESPQKIYVIGKARSFEYGEGDKKTYVQEFFGTSQPPVEDGSKDTRRGGIFRAETTEPFVDMNEFSGKNQMLIVSGQTFSVPGKDKEGKESFYRKMYVRSIKTAKFEEREVNGEKKSVAVGDKDVMSTEIAAKKEFYSANRRSLNGFINGTKLNQEIKDKDGAVYAYRQFMYVGKNGKSTQVAFYTKDPVDPESFAKGKKISMPGAMHVVTRQNKEGKYVREEVFEPNYIGEYISKEKKKEAEQEPVGMTPEEIRDADEFVPGIDDDYVPGQDEDFEQYPYSDMCL